MLNGFSDDQDYEVGSDRIEPKRFPMIPDGTGYRDDVKDGKKKRIETYLKKERAKKAYEEKEAQFPEPAEHLREVERVSSSACD